MAKKLTEEAIEQAAEVADVVAGEATNVAEATRRVSPKDIRLILFGAGIGVAGGIAIGYFVSRKKLEAKYLKIANDEIQETRMHDAVKLRETVKAMQNSNAKLPIDEVMKARGYKSKLEGPDEVLWYRVAPEPVPEVEANIDHMITDITEEISSEWDYHTEIKKRDETKPYIIHRDEFSSGADGNNQSSLTYYAGDEVLCDERDSIIENKDKMVGLENLERFGHGSEDPDVLYIRNTPLGMDIEIIRSDGKYAIEVAGFTEEDDLKHSDTRIRKPGRHGRSRRGFDDNER